MVFCANGHSQPDTARFCGVCGAPIVTAPQPTAEQPVAAQPQPTGYAAPAPAGPPPQPRDRTTTVLIAAIVVVALVIVGLGAFLVLAQDDDPVETADSTTTTQTAGADGGSTETTAATTTPSSAPATPPPTVPPTVPPTPAPATGSWITVLASIPEGDSGLPSRVAELTGRYPSATTLRSDGYASLQPGYVVVYDGVFATGGAARQHCYELGLTSSNSCYAAPLSQDVGDRDERLYP